MNNHQHQQHRPATSNNPQRSPSNNNGAGAEPDEYVSGNVTPNPGSDPTAPPQADDDETQFRLLAAAAAVNSAASDRIGSNR